MLDAEDPQIRDLHAPIPEPVLIECARKVQHGRRGRRVDSAAGVPRV